MRPVVRDMRRRGGSKPVISSVVVIGKPMTVPVAVTRAPRPYAFGSSGSKRLKPCIHWSALRWSATNPNTRSCDAATWIDRSTRGIGHADDQHRRAGRVEDLL